LSYTGQSFEKIPTALLNSWLTPDVGFPGNLFCSQNAICTHKLFDISANVIQWCFRSNETNQWNESTRAMLHVS